MDSTTRERLVDDQRRPHHTRLLFVTRVWKGSHIAAEAYAGTPRESRRRAWMLVDAIALDADHQSRKLAVRRTKALIRRKAKRA